ICNTADGSRAADRVGGSDEGWQGEAASACRAWRRDAFHGTCAGSGWASNATLVRATDMKRIIGPETRGMQTGLATTDVAGTAVSLPAEIRERMQSMLASRVRPTRGKAYRNDWRVWERWAVEYGASALLSAMSARRKLSTLRRYLTS